MVDCELNKLAASSCTLCLQSPFSFPIKQHPLAALCKMMPKPPSTEDITTHYIQILQLVPHSVLPLYLYFIPHGSSAEGITHYIQILQMVQHKEALYLNFILHISSTKTHHCYIQILEIILHNVLPLYLYFIPHGSSTEDITW